MSDRTPHPPYWFFHEYLDEARRPRVNKVTADTEADARTRHRQAADFHWITHHIEPSISPLFHHTEGMDRAIIPGQRPDHPYRHTVEPTPMPDYIRAALTKARTRDADVRPA